MSEIIRYTKGYKPVFCHGELEFEDTMDVSDNGKWVKYDDYKARIKELESALDIALSCVDSDDYNQALSTAKKRNRI